MSGNKRTLQSNWLQPHINWPRRKSIFTHFSPAVVSHLSSDNKKVFHINCRMWGCQQPLHMQFPQPYMPLKMLMTQIPISRTRLPLEYLQTRLLQTKMKASRDSYKISIANHLMILWKGIFKKRVSKL